MSDSCLVDFLNVHENVHIICVTVTSSENKLVISLQSLADNTSAAIVVLQKKKQSNIEIYSLLLVQLVKICHMMSWMYFCS